MDKITVKDLEVFANHGVYEQENFLSKYKTRRNKTMKKGTMMVFSALLMSCFLAVPAEAKSIENGTYRV